MKGVSEKGEGDGRKGIACSQSGSNYRQVQFDWLVASQSKSDIRNLTFMHNSTSGTRQDQNTYDQV